MISDFRFKNRKSKIESQKFQVGFTLVEIIIYMAIIGLTTVAFVTLSISTAESRNKNYAVQEVQANARVALQIISDRMRAATGVNTGSSTFGSDPGVLSLVMADAAKNPTIISLTADDGVLQIAEGVSTAVPITSDELNVTNLVFTDLTPSGTRENIRVELTIEFDNPSGDVEFDASQSWQTTVSLRQ